MLHGIAAAIPAAVSLAGLLWLEPHSLRLRWTLMLVALVPLPLLALSLRDQVARPLQTLANLLSAMRNGDFSRRGLHQRHDDALGVAIGEVNALAAVLQRERYGTLEASALVKKAIDAMDAALFVVDAQGVITLCNASACRLVGVAPNLLVGERADALGLGALVEGESPRTVSLTLAGRPRRLEVQVGPLRQDGRPSRMVLATDVSQALRAEERGAYQRLVRVFGHEINNSLAPIRSIAESLRHRVASPDAELLSDLARGLEVIERRSAGLSRFLDSYSRLMRLPPPQLSSGSVEAWIRRVAALVKGRSIAIVAGAELSIRADGDQLDQLLINLVNNASEAMAGADGVVELAWEATPDQLVVRVRDEGPGLPDTANLFVPFFTTKPNGSGIGLVLSRQIAENHGGTLTLSNRTDRCGCEARVSLPRR